MRGVGLAGASLISVSPLKLVIFLTKLGEFPFLILPIVVTVHLGPVISVGHMHRAEGWGYPQGLCPLPVVLLQWLLHDSIPSLLG